MNLQPAKAGNVARYGVRSAIVCITLATIALGQPAESGDVFRTEIEGDDRYGLLEQIVAELRANHEGLRTWSAKCAFVDRQLIDKDEGKYTWDETAGAPEFPILREDTGEIRFEADFTTHRLRVNFTPQQRSRLIKPGVREPVKFTAGPMPHQQLSVLTPDRYWHRQSAQKFVRFTEIPGLKSDGYIAFRDPTEAGSSRSRADVFDPQQMLRHSRPIWEEVQLVLDALNGKGLPPGVTAEAASAGIRMFHLAVPGTGESVNLQLKLPSIDKEQVARFVSYNFVPANRYFPSLIGIEELPGKRLQQTMWECGRIGEYVVPTKYMFFDYTDDDEQQVQYSRVVDIRDSRINEPLDNSLFDHHGLELHDGDILIDRVEQLGYRYSGGKLTEPIEFGTAAPDVLSQTSGSNSTTIAVMVVLNVAALVIIIGLSARRRGRV